MKDAAKSAATLAIPTQNAAFGNNSDTIIPPSSGLTGSRLNAASTAFSALKIPNKKRAALTSGPDAKIKHP